MNGQPVDITMPQLTEGLRQDVTQIMKQASDTQAEQDAAICARLASFGTPVLAWREACEECRRRIRKDAGLQ